MPRTSTFDRLMKTFDVESPFKRTNNNSVSYFIVFLVLVMMGYAISMYLHDERDEQI